MNNNFIKKDSKAYYLQQYNIARGNLLLMTILTLINVILFILGSDTMLLFSAMVPYLAVVLGIVSKVSLLGTIGIIIAAIIILVYLLCWLFSKKHYGWMIATLVLFSIDTIVLIAFLILSKDVSVILDVIIHIWVFYYLIIGVKTGAKLNKLSPDEIESEEKKETNKKQITNSKSLRTASNEVKYRILIEGDFLGHHIEYRRVKRVNELVIDGLVYDEIEMLVEKAHQLDAIIDGHNISVGNDGARSYISIDGEITAKKIRLI